MNDITRRGKQHRKQERHLQDRSQDSGRRPRSAPQANRRTRRERADDRQTWIASALRWITGSTEQGLRDRNSTGKNQQESSFPLVSRKPLKANDNIPGKKAAAQPKQRLYAVAHKVFDLEPEMTRQARVLNEKEIRKVLLYIANHKHASRNRCLFLFTHLVGTRVGETAKLRICDVLASDGDIRDEVRLSAEQTKGDRGRTLYISERMKDELRRYLRARFNITDIAVVTYTDTSRALFPTQKHADRGFTPSTLAQYFHYLYKSCGLDGASSHSGRRYFATSLSEKAVSPKTLQHLLGHAQIQTTMRYIEVTPSHMRAAVALL
jgi:integrase/recombinase XerD